MAHPGIDRARRLLAAGDVGGARREAQAVLRANADRRDRCSAHLLLADCSRRAGDGASALTHARSAVSGAPDDPVAHYALAELLEAAGDKAGAAASLREAVRLNPRFAAAWSYFGILVGEAGDTAGAEQAFATTVQLDPQRATAWNNLGNAQRTLGRLEDAATSFARALALRPDYPLAAANLATAQRDLGEYEAAEATARAALARRQPGQVPYRPLVVVLAGLLRERGAFEESAQLYLQAIQAAPDQSAGEWISLARVVSELGDPVRARDAYARSRAVDPRDLRSALGMHLTLPIVYDSAEAVSAARTAYAEGLATLRRELDTLVAPLSEVEVLDGFRWTNFFLAYQGRDDRALQASYAELMALAIDKRAPQWHAPLPTRPKRQRLRVGFASAFFHEGTCGRYFSRWITDLDRERFEVYAYHLFAGFDAVANMIQERADGFRIYGGSRARPSIVANDIRADELDVLIYPELGMDVTSFALAALRLAPRQYAAWGHPVTTGHATIDGYFSCEAMEPEDGAAQYTEKLVLLPGLGTHYAKPAVPLDAERARFNLPTDRQLLLCPQSTFKIHPDNDELFAHVLEANRGAKLVLFAGRHPVITDQYMRRLTRAFERHGLPIRERAIVLPPLPHQDFLRVNKVCDAMLDTLHWSGGNTSLDALACGLPIVTLPGAHMRGRQSLGMLSLLGVPELVARDHDDYVAIASRLVTDSAWRDNLSARIVAAHDKLFDVPDAIVRLQQVLLEGTIVSCRVDTPPAPNEPRR